MFMFKVLVYDPICDFGLKQLRDAEDVEVVKQTGLSEDELIATIDQYDALLVRSQTTVTERVMEAGVNLKVIGRAGVGVDNIDLDARSEEHTSELQSRGHLVCRLLLEKKKQDKS